MATDKVILCRRLKTLLLTCPPKDGEMCCKTIEHPNPLNWCDDCRKNLPFWPR